SCDVAESCTGSSADCPADAFQPSSFVCRASVGQCNLAEQCTGSSEACPANAFAVSSTHCTGASQEGACDNDTADHCTGTDNSCVNVYQPGNFVCRSSAGQCDVAEQCTKSNRTCPADAFASSATNCTGASQGGACDNDGADRCTGTSNT